MLYRSTRQVSKMLQVNTATLSTAVWAGRIAEPEKGPGGSFLWTDADIQRAARYFNIKVKQEVSDEW